jgi:hypothetical protein
MKVKEIVLNQTGRHAFVIDENNDQWFCHLSRQDDISINDFLIDVYLYFMNDRREFFQCDVA